MDFANTSTSHQNISNRGFSLIEIILAVSISLMLALFTGTSWIQYYRRQKVETVTTNIATLLQDTRNRAITAENGFTYGVRIITDVSHPSIEIIESSDGSSWEISTLHASRGLKVPNGITIANSDGLSTTTSNPEIYFEKRTGNALLTATQGTVTISDSLYRMQLNISPTGNFTLSQIEKIN